MKKNISELMEKEWKNRALYVLQERAIPSVIDGFKPVQRFLFYEGLKEAKTKFKKVTALGGTISSIGYVHGETSAFDALIDMSAEYCNNLPVFIGDGNFGTRLDHNAAAPRYIYSKLNSIYNELYIDNELLEKNADDDILTPVYYLPIIPMILVNGIKGIATGYSCDIPPHCPKSIIKSLLSLCEKGVYKNIVPKYYNSKCKISRVENSYIIEGKYELKNTNTIIITEILPQYDVAAYEKILDNLEEKGIIISYENLSVDDKFEFVVKIKRNNNFSHEKILKTFKLQTTHTWNLTSISNEGTLQIWEPTNGFRDMMLYFYNFRLAKIKERIEKRIEFLELETQEMHKYCLCVEDIHNDKIQFKGKKKDELSDFIKERYKVQTEKYLKIILRTPIVECTADMISELKEKYQKMFNELNYLKHTTPEIEFKNNLEDLLKVI